MPSSRHRARPRPTGARVLAKNVALAPAELEFVSREFARYYATHRPAPPPRLPRREVALFPFAATDLMRRHLAFRRPEELGSLFGRDPPRHLYYSTAYYATPDAPTMNAKEWLGADLIFDLDADHLRGGEALEYPAQLERVKERFRTLLDDFLFGDFGLDPADALLVFSGNRGYHAHIRSEAVLSLTSAERRELVEYILGIGADPSSALVRERSSGAEAIVVHGESPGSGRSRAPRSLARPFVHLAPLDAPGWQGLTSRALLKLLDRWEEGGVDVAVAEIKATGVDQTLAASLAHQLLAKGRPHMIRQGRSLDVFPRAVSEELIKSVMKLASVEVQGETDAPVTTDIHRLIRWPGSLHGGSGLRVLPISRDELDRFEPLREAVPESNGSARVRVELTETVRLPFGEGTLAGSAGERLDLEAPAATFLMLRGEARLAPAPPG